MERLAEKSANHRTHPIDAGYLERCLPPQYCLLFLNLFLAVMRVHLL